MPAESPWTCESCHTPIPNGHGVVLVFNSNTALAVIGAYPVAATPELDDLLGPRPNVSFAAFCQGCHPYRDLNPYEIPASPSLLNWAAWVLHLHEKTWMGPSDLHRMLGYWYHNRDLEPGRHLD